MKSMGHGGVIPQARYHCSPWTLCPRPYVNLFAALAESTGTLMLIPRQEHEEIELMSIRPHPQSPITLTPNLGIPCPNEA